MRCELCDDPATLHIAIPYIPEELDTHGEPVTETRYEEWDLCVDHAFELMDDPAYKPAEWIVFEQDDV